jgi:hypothetical protein
MCRPHRTRDITVDDRANARIAIDVARWTVCIRIRARFCESVLRSD